MKTVNALKAHVAIYVKDLAASVDFYRTLFGIEPAKMAPGYAKFDVQNPPLNFTLNERSGSPGGGLSHMGIQVSSTEDVLAIGERWREAGLGTRDEMKIDCCHALQDKTWVKDPDGNEWEVFVVLRDNLPKKTSAEQKTCCAPTCCAAMPAA
jgi:catechol 2,3-dioxygenase-like lactoylglutathione lyase family enzyme